MPKRPKSIKQRMSETGIPEVFDRLFNSGDKHNPRIPKPMLQSSGVRPPKTPNQRRPRKK
ncbi:MAG: hypothetical protein ACYTFN_24835 [Planctomycetota bacterium]